MARGEDMEILLKARDLAKNAHNGQKRKISGKPYFTHVENVAAILKQSGFPDSVVAAGYLHDVIEDTDVSQEDIREIFGEEILQLVLHNTENKDLEWEQRKQATILKAQETSFEIKALIAADKLDNSQDLLNFYQKYGDKVWEFFNRGYEKQAWYYKELTEALFKNVNETEIPDFFHILRSNVENLFCQKEM